MAEAGWTAQGLLRPLWQDYPGGRDALADAVGTKGSVLSSINSGKRPIGHDLAGRLARELGVTLSEMGATEADAADPASRTLLGRLSALEDAVAAILEGQQEGLKGQDRILKMCGELRGMFDARLP